MKILIVDDHELVREALSTLLEAEGFEIVGPAKDGAQALSLFDDQLPDVVLMDVRMPEMNGAEVTRRIMEIKPSTRVIGLSMHQSDEIEDEMLEAGALFYFRKDRSWSELIQRLKALREDDG